MAPSRIIERMEKHLVRVSKLLSLVLRHKPEQLGLTLQADGWARVDELLRALAEYGCPVTRDVLVEVVETNDKRRFSFSEDGTRIRAVQGHSLDIEIAFPEKDPPEVLYHGTVRQALAGIRAEGLVPMGRQYVHLSDTVATARNVGSRRGKPVVLIVHAERMAKDGFPFYLSENGVWLTKCVPCKYLEGDGL